jgi:hypothetical protein
MKLEGASALKISEELNKLGILSPIEYKKSLGLPHPKGGYGYKSEGKWSATTIIRILQDEIYTVFLVQGKRETPNYKIRNVITKPYQEWIRIEHAHRPLLILIQSRFTHRPPQTPYSADFQSLCNF